MTRIILFCFVGILLFADTSAAMTRDEQIASLTPAIKKEADLGAGIQLLGLTSGNAPRQLLWEGERGKIMLFFEKRIETEEKRLPLSLWYGSQRLVAREIDVSARSIGEVFTLEIEPYLPLRPSDTEACELLLRGSSALSVSLPLRIMPKKAFESDIVLDEKRQSNLVEGFGNGITHRGDQWPTRAPKGWTLLGGNSDVSLLVDKTHRCNDESTLVANIVGEWPANWYHLFQDIPVSSSRHYRLTYAVQQASQSEGYRPSFEVLGIEEKSGRILPLSFESASGSVFHQAEGWTLTRLFFTTNQEDTLLRVRLRVNVTDATVASSPGAIAGGWRIGCVSLEEIP